MLQGFNGGGERCASALRFLANGGCVPRWFELVDPEDLLATFSQGCCYSVVSNLPHPSPPAIAGVAVHSIALATTGLVAVARVISCL